MSLSMPHSPASLHLSFRKRLLLSFRRCPPLLHTSSIPGKEAMCAHNGITFLEAQAPEQHDAVLVLPRRGSHPPGQSPEFGFDTGCRPAPADAYTTLGRTPHAQHRQAADHTSSARLFGCGTHGSSLVLLWCSERS